MVRSKNTLRRPSLSGDVVAPLVGGDRPNLASAFQAIVTWSTSRTNREEVMRGARFPLPDDLGAFLVINQLIYRGVARPTDLADAIDVTRSKMSRIVARLEDADLVYRAADPRDDRGVVIVLTSEGREVAQRIIHAAGTDATSLPGISDEEFRTLEALMVKFATAIDALPGHPLSTTAGMAFSDSST